jgi:CubicO group peptidase (beta-lactamase class C family)
MSHSTATADALRSRLDSTVPEVMARAGVPGAAVGLRVGDAEVSVGYGVTSVEDPLPVHDHTLFQIGSVTKTFTATAIMALAERGALALDDPVRQHLAAFRLADRRDTERLTVRHLLTHTGGFVGDWFLIHPPELGEGEDALGRLVVRLADVPQLFPPGAAWSYNNAGFSLAGRIVEVVTGQPYAAALRALVLEPLGLERTFVSADEAITHRVAAPHGSRETPPRLLRGAGWQPGWQLARADVPIGGLISSARDLLAWARFHLGHSDGNAPLSSAAVAAMQVPLAPAGCFADHVGVSWMLRDVGGRGLVFHGGLTTGYATGFTLAPDADAAVVVLTNGTPGGTWLGREVTRLVLRDTIGVDDAPPSPMGAWTGDLLEYAGRYDNPFAVQEIAPGGSAGELLLRYHAHPPARGRWAPPVPPSIRLAFYAPDSVVALEPPDQAGLRGEFGRDARGDVAWLRWGGRVAPRLDATGHHQASPAAAGRHRPKAVEPGPSNQGRRTNPVGSNPSDPTEAP